MGVEDELVGKVQLLLRDKFGGTDADARLRLFEAYDANHDGEVDKDELLRLLADAGIGNPTTRSMWVAGVMSRVDSDKSSTISYAELEDLFTARATRRRRRDV